MVSTRVLLAGICVLVGFGLIFGTWSTAPAFQGTQSPLRIGASISLSGQYQSIGHEIRDGWELWASQVNRRGGILGRRVELVIYDDASDAEVAAGAYERLIADDKVDCIFGPYSTPITLRASEVSERAGYPMIATGASGTEIWTRGFRNVFGIYALGPTHMDGALSVAADNGYTTVGIISENSAAVREIAGSAAEKAKLMGMEVVAHEEFEPGTPDLTPLMISVSAMNPDLLIGGVYSDEGVHLVRQLRALKWAPKMVVLTAGPGLPEFQETLGADAEYIFGSSQWEPSAGGAGVAEFVSSYMATFGEIPGYHAAGGFVSGQLLEQAILRAGAIDNARIRDALVTMETTTVYGSYKVDASGAQTGKPMYLLQWLDGERKTVWPLEFADAEYVLPMPQWGQR